MRKLQLDLDDLSVQSFAPAPARTARGTAHAHAAYLPEMDDTAIVPGDTEPGMNCFTCELSCRGC